MTKKTVHCPTIVGSAAVFFSDRVIDDDSDNNAQNTSDSNFDGEGKTDDQYSQIQLKRGSHSEMLSVIQPGKGRDSGCRLGDKTAEHDSRQ